MPLVCRAEPEELEEVLALDRRVLPGCAWWTPDPVGALFVVRDLDERVCAYASIKPSSRWDQTAYMDRAGVAPHARGRGLQRALIHARLRWARRQGMTHAITETVAFNPASQNSLIRCGFRTYWPSYPWSPAPDAVYWIRKL